jgi:hypothetical protein
MTLRCISVVGRLCVDHGMASEIESYWWQVGNPCWSSISCCLCVYRPLVIDLCGLPQIDVLSYEGCDWVVNYVSITF